jgi:uncharacterized protein YdcH (DUF465 family)
VTHPGSVRELGRLSASKAADFSWTKLLEKFEQLYDEITASAVSDIQ